MKQIDIKEIGKLSGKEIGKNETFHFQCHPNIACFNRCCRNLNLFLYPYDVVRLKKRLAISSDAFIENHVDVVMREGNFFPDVLLKMADNKEKTCPYLMDAGCDVYLDRPDACRTFPLEVGMLYQGDNRPIEPVYFFRPPDFCDGPKEKASWTPETWIKDQEAETYNRMTARWSEVKGLFGENPWGAGGMADPKLKMAFMAAYNVDKFREFVLGSSFLKRFKVASKTLKKIKRSDTALMLLGFSWIKLFVWGKPSKEIKPK
jgi:uncharacterized protein